MQPNSRILAAIDRSTLSTRVIRGAIDLAVAMGAELEFLSVDTRNGEEIDKQIQAHLQQFIKEQMDVLHADSLICSLTVRIATDVAEEVVSYCGESGHSMIIIGTHGRRGFRKLMLGSVALEVIRTASAPVLTIGDNDDTDAAQNPFGQLLIPFDFSDQSKEALEYGIRIAERLNARIDVVHVIEDTLYPAFYGPFVQSVYDANPGLEDLAEEKLTRLVEESGIEMGRVAIKILRGHPAHEITTYAKDRAMDMIVMATHGLSGMQHLFVGSVAERTVQRAHCPVLTLRPEPSKDTA